MPFYSYDLWSDERSQSLPALQRLFEETKGCTSETFWDFEVAFEKFFRSDFLSKFLYRQVSSIEQETDYDAIQSDDELELIRGEGFRISMGKLRASPSPLAGEYTEIACYASDFMCVNLGPSSLEVDSFQFPADRNIEFFERTVRPTSLGHRQQLVGEVLKARAGLDVLRFSPPPRDSFQLFAISLKPRVPLLWHFDATTLDAKYCTSANLMSSRIQTGIDILVRMKRADAVPAIVEAAKSKDHFVRWTAITSVVCMDQAKGIDLLHNALTDAHPDVRSAASKALEMMAPSKGTLNGNNV